MEHSSRKTQYIVTFAVSLAAVTAGVTVFWSAPVIPKFHNNETTIHITDNEISWMTAMSSPGFMVGSLATRFIADRLGRRASILGSAVPFTIGTVILAVANQAWMLYLTRFLWGCGTGVIVTVSGIYLVEIADKDIRGRLSVANRFMFNSGSFLMMTIGPFVCFQTLTYMLLVLPIIFFVVCWWIPETPYYYLKEGKVDAARQNLMQLRGYKDEKVLEEQLSLMRSDVKKEMRRSGSAKELFTGKQYRRALIVAAGLKLTQIMSGSVPVTQYLGSIMQDSKSGLEVSTALIIFAAARFAVGIISSILVDRVGRRPLLVCSYFGTSVSFIIVGIYFYFQEVIGIENEETNPYRHIAFIGITFSIVISTLGFDSLIYVIPAEIFPINVKSLAMTLLNILGGCLNFTVVKCYQELKDSTGLCGVFWFFAISAFIGTIFSYFVVPETKGKSLREIQIELQGNIYDDGNDRVSKYTNEGDDADEIMELKEINEVKANNENELSLANNDAARDATIKQN